MDNASYHSQRSDPVPVKRWTKKRMQEWLLDKGMNFPLKAKKAETFDIITRLNLTPRYFVDDMAADAGWLHTWQLRSSEITHKAYPFFRASSGRASCGPHTQPNSAGLGSSEGPH